MTKHHCHIFNEIVEMSQNASMKLVKIETCPKMGKSRDPRTGA